MLEKCGKTCQVLLSPDEVVLIQTQFNTDGIHACARFSVVSPQPASSAPAIGGTGTPLLAKAFGPA